MLKVQLFYYNVWSSFLASKITVKFKKKKHIYIYIYIYICICIFYILI